MRKIHLKRTFDNRYTLCGITPDKDRFTTTDRVSRLKPDDICKVCLRVQETGKQTAPEQRSGA